MCDMLHARLAITKLQMQLRKVESTQKVFTSYATLEIRLVIHETVVVQTTNVSGPRPYVKSLFRDDEIRTMLLSAFHREMVRWSSDEIEDFPKPFEGDAMIN